jgi:hypothetical protein
LLAWRIATGACKRFEVIIVVVHVGAVKMYYEEPVMNPFPNYNDLV